MNKREDQIVLLENNAKFAWGLFWCDYLKKLQTRGSGKESKGYLSVREFTMMKVSVREEKSLGVIWRPWTIAAEEPPYWHGHQCQLNTKSCWVRTVGPDGLLVLLKKEFMAGQTECHTAIITASSKSKGECTSVETEGK
jgi:hypothetical protein